MRFMVFLQNKDDIEVKEEAQQKSNICFSISRTSIGGPGICRFTTMSDRFMPSAGMQWGRKQSVMLNGQL